MKVRKCMEQLTQNIKEPSVINTECVEYADLLFGVGSATSAGPCVPNGSIHPSPETLEKDTGGYYRNQPIVGFGQAYISGSGGHKCYGNFLLAPMVDKLTLEDADRASFAKSGTEIAKCYQYSVELENGIKVKLTPNHDSAIYEIEYPKGKEAFLVLDAARKLDIKACMRSGRVVVDGNNNLITGGGICTGNWNHKDWNMYFSMSFDSCFEEIGSFKDDELIPAIDGTQITEIDDFIKLGTYIKFGTPKETLKVRVKIAISFVSENRAKEYMDTEITGFDYQKAMDSAKEKWQKMFSVIDLGTDNPDTLKRFYTAMYHMNVQPRNRVHDHGQWDDFHTVWDTWKTVYPMYSLLYPDKMRIIVESFIDRYKLNQKLGNGIVVGDQYMTAIESVPGQGGNDVDNAIADAYLKGIRLERYTWQDAYQLLLASAEQMRSKEYVEGGFATDNAKTVSGVEYSWRFKSAAATLGFAFNDKAISNVAKELGTQEEYEKYHKRGANWLNVWNKDIESEGFYGFPQKCNNDGSFDAGFDAHGGYNSHFYEATGWDASYINYNDVPRLVEAMGGSETFTKRLLWACEHSKDYYNDDDGKEGYLNFTNEPSFHIPWLFCTDEVKRPDLAAKVIDDVIARFSVLNDYPGDEDNGGMSSYYVFLMCGFFPYATTEYYYLHGARVENVTFNLGNGKKFVITGENAGGKNIYVQSATWQGKPYNSCKMTHSQILEGGELHFVMGDTPSMWGRQ